MKRKMVARSVVLILITLSGLNSLTLTSSPNLNPSMNSSIFQSQTVGNTELNDNFSPHFERFPIKPNSIYHEFIQEKPIEIRTISNHSTFQTLSDPSAFISVWDTTNTGSGSSASNQIHLPLEEDGTYNFIVDWGDGINDTITIWNQLETTHTYSSGGIYRIKITGTIIGWRLGGRSGQDGAKILLIQQWGCLQLGNNGWNFAGCRNMEITAPDPNMTFGDSLSFAMKREDKAFKLYSLLAEISEDDDISVLFLGLAKEEEQHFIKIEKTYKSFFDE